MAVPAELQGVNNDPCALQLGGSPAYVYTGAYSVCAHDRVAGLNKVLHCCVLTQNVKGEVC